jgi:eukaryotic-like serine/threonine-protein kinase
MPRSVRRSLTPTGPAERREVTMSTKSSGPTEKSILLESPLTALLGSHIGSYEIVRQIGAGMAGGVFLAKHKKLGTQKAIKVLVAPFCSSDRAVARFEREAATVAKLHHRNIIQIDDVGEMPNGQRYILMPFVEGMSLEQFLVERPGPVSIHLTLHILGQVCAALDTAHASGVVHRDLKPTNILLSNTPSNPWQVTLLDFGVAKLRTDFGSFQTERGEVLGTPSYMAAEHIDDASTADHRSDIFSLGVIAYRMITGGELPFGPSKKPVELYRMQRVERPRRPMGVPVGWAELILSALALLPQDRPASAAEFALLLAAATPPRPPAYPDGETILAAVARELLAAGSGPVLIHPSERGLHGSVSNAVWPLSATWTSSAVGEQRISDASAIPVHVLDPDAPTLTLRKVPR